MDKPKVVFTNGCFDILHVGHIELLRKARELGDRLVVGLNSDQSIKQIKGLSRPIIPQEERYIMLKNLEVVDSVIIFDEPDPLRLIEKINPDVLVKGGDWGLGEIIGEEYVLENGGLVVRVDLVDGLSTTNIVTKIGNYYKKHLFELLAVMHRDGGHYTHDHGVEKAVEDAMTIYYDLRTHYEENE